MVTISTIIMIVIVATVSSGYQLPCFGGGASVTLISHVRVYTKKFLLPIVGN